MAKTVKVRGYTRSAPKTTPKRKTPKRGIEVRPGVRVKSVKASKPGDRYGSQPHQRMPRKGEL